MTGLPPLYAKARENRATVHEWGHNCVAGGAHLSQAFQVTLLLRPLNLRLSGLRQCILCQPCQLGFVLPGSFLPGGLIHRQAPLCFQRRFHLCLEFSICMQTQADLRTSLPQAQACLSL